MEFGTFQSRQISTERSALNKCNSLSTLRHFHKLAIKLTCEQRQSKYIIFRDLRVYTEIK